MKHLTGRTTLVVMVAVLMLTGCLRSAGDNLSDVDSRPLNTSTPRPTIPPTAEPQSVTEIVVVTATDDPDAIPTETPSATPTEEVLVAQNVVPQEQEATPTEDQGIGSQQVEDPLLLTATGIVREATQRALNQTATAEAPDVQLPTFTPTDDPNLVPQPGTATPTQGFVSGGSCVHEVTRGENLFRLSLRYGVSVADLATASGISNFNLIYPGQKITVPGCGTTGAVPPPTSAPTQAAFNTAGTGGTTTGTNNFQSAGGIQHTVQQYETLFEISQRYGVPVDAIAQANGITNPNLILMTDVLTIP